MYPNPAAHKRGLELLELVLSPGEYTQYKSTKELWVNGSEGGLYRIDTTSHEGNVYYYEGGQKICSFCAHPRMRLRDGQVLPASDCAVAQALAIKRDENEFLAVAFIYNVWVQGIGQDRKIRAENAVFNRRRARDRLGRFIAR